MPSALQSLKPQASSSQALSSISAGRASYRPHHLREPRAESSRLQVQSSGAWQTWGLQYEKAQVHRARHFYHETHGSRESAFRCLGFDPADDSSIHAVVGAVTATPVHFLFPAVQTMSTIQTQLLESTPSRPGLNRPRIQEERQHRSHRISCTNLGLVPWLASHRQAKKRGSNGRLHPTPPLTTESCPAIQFRFQICCPCLRLGS